MEIPDTFLEAISITTILTTVLGYRQDQLAMAIEGTDLHIGVPADKIHFLAGPLPPECIGSNYDETSSLTKQAWMRHVEVFNQLEPDAKSKIVINSSTYKRRTDIASQFVAIGITPPRLMS